MSNTFNHKVQINKPSDFTLIHGEADEDSVLVPFDMRFGHFVFFFLQLKFILNRLLDMYRELLAN